VDTNLKAILFQSFSENHLAYSIFLIIPKTPTIACFAPPSFGSSYGTFFDGFGRGIGGGVKEEAILRNRREI
jgi:hypothetical protein